MEQKTITLRMTDLEAIALDRIAYLNGVSKNKMLRQMIAREYEALCPGSVVRDEIFLVTTPIDFPDDLKNTIEASGKDLTDKDNAALILKAYNYALENSEKAPADARWKLEEDYNAFRMQLAGV